MKKTRTDHQGDFNLNHTVRDQFAIVINTKVDQVGSRMWECPIVMPFKEEVLILRSFLVKMPPTYNASNTNKPGMKGRPARCCRARNSNSRGVIEVDPDLWGISGQPADHDVSPESL